MGASDPHPTKKSKIAGQRSRKLEKAFHSTVKYALKGIPMDEFETYFPPGVMTKEVLGAAYDAYMQVGERRLLRRSLCCCLLRLAGWLAGLESRWRGRPVLMF
jgi:hypothetical protein